MIHSTKNDQYWLFWCQWWSDHQDQNYFWGNWHLEAVEAAEVAKAAEINEAGEVSKGLKNHYCGLQKSSRFLNPIFWGLYFDVLKKKSFDRILKTHIESYHLYCRRPLRLCGVKKNHMIDQAEISTTQEVTEHQFLVHLSKHLVKPGLYFVSKPNGRPCRSKIFRSKIV